MKFFQRYVFVKNVSAENLSNLALDKETENDVPVNVSVGLHARNLIGSQLMVIVVL